MTTYSSCYEKIGSERVNEIVSFEGDRREQCAQLDADRAVMVKQFERSEGIQVPARLRAFRGARRHLDSFSSF